MDQREAEPSRADRWLHVLRRLGAYGIDIALVFAIYAVVQSLLFPIVQERYPAVTQSGWALELYVVLTISLPVWFYFIISERSQQQATVGKRLLGLKVIGASLAAVTTGRIVLRTFGKLLPWELAHFANNVPTNPWLDPETVFSPWRLIAIGLVYVLIIVYLISVIRRPEQCVYDRLAQTVVVPTSG